MTKILVIEDDPTIVKGLVSALEFHGFQVLCAGDSDEGLVIFENEEPHLVIIDIMLPGLDGFEVCKRIRGNDQKTPIIILSARSQENDKLLGFELGADDYVTKPFSARELVARIKANLKRTPGVEIEDLRRVAIGDALVNFVNFTVSRSGKEYTLSPKENGILKLLVENPGRVVTRNEIIDLVWGDDYFPTPKTIDNFIRKIRVKIEKNTREPRYIITVHGAGYKFKP